MSTLSFPGPVTVADPVQDGVYAFPFDHAGQQALYVYFALDGTEIRLDLNTDYTVTPIDRGYGGGTITLLADPPVGASLVIDRLTPDIQGASLKTLERPIEHALDQLTQAVQDRARVLDRALKFPRTGGAYEADDRRIANMADPEARTDAATMGYVDDQFAPYVDGFDTALASAQAAQEAAEGARDDAADSAQAAGASEANAASSETAAASSEANAGASETAAATSEANAATSEANALASEVAARSSELAAAGSAGDAAASASAAEASETAAGNSEAAALSSAQDAASSAETAGAQAEDAAESASAASTSEGKAEEWAEGTGEPGGPGTASAKAWASKAETEADRAQGIADGLGDPVAYTPQEKDPAEQAIARDNIGLTVSDPVLARLNASKDHSTEDWGAGLATEGGLISPAQLKQAAGTPIGGTMFFALSTAPHGWLVCDGSAVTSLYPELRQALIDDGYKWGQDGSGNPLLPNPVDGNRFPRAAGGDLPVGTVQGDAIRNITAEVSFGDNYDRGSFNSNAQGAFVTHGLQNRVSNTNAGSNNGNKFLTFDASRVVPTADENRPKAVAMLLCIKAFGSVVNIPGTADMNGWLAQAKADAQQRVDTAIGELVLPFGPGWDVVDVTGSRSPNTWYTNSTENPIQLNIMARSSSNNTGRDLYMSEDLVEEFRLARFGYSTQPFTSVSAIILPGWSYMFDGALNSPSINEVRRAS